VETYTEVAAGSGISARTLTTAASAIANPAREKNQCLHHNSVIEGKSSLEIANYYGHKRGYLTNIYSFNFQQLNYIFPCFEVTCTHS
jgi:hypothetical protein